MKVLSSKKQHFFFAGTLTIISSLQCTSINDDGANHSPSSKEQRNAGSIQHYMRKGPHSFSQLTDFRIRISAKVQLVTDVYLANLSTKKAPLVIFQHGNRSDKSRHRNQAKHLATWGFHSLVLNQPNRHQWMENGHNLSRLIRLLHQWPRMLDNKFLPNSIILVGHSFGGSAIAIAAGKKSPVRGLIFLDPALFDPKVKAYLKRVSVPSIIIGADRRIFTARKRQAFYRSIPRNIMEVSVKNATHNDAQNPNMFVFKEFFGLSPAPSEIRQNFFMGAIVASVTSLANGSTNRAWKLLTAKTSPAFIEQRKK